MSRVKPFLVEVKVHGQLVADDFLTAEALAHDVLRAIAKQDLVGPRGGRYVPVNQPHHFDYGQTGDDWARNKWTFTARVTGRYVPPSRAAA